MKENKIETNLNNAEIKREESINLTEVVNMPKKKPKKKTGRKKPIKVGYKRIKRPGGGVTYTRRKKPLQPTKKKRRRKG